MRRIVIDISDTSFDLLVREAADERRAARDQAAILLELALSNRQDTDEPTLDRDEPLMVAP